MNSLALPFYRRPFACHYRPLILGVSAVMLFGAFWFFSRYPQLFDKARHLGGAVPTMAFNHEVIHVEASDPIWRQILANAADWWGTMAIGMSFGVLLGALLHTILRYYPLKIGSNLYLNSLKGALVGMPAGVCVNCSVPTACGITRGHGRVEVALGFLFSSPNFNPVVVMMTFVALPLSMAVTKYVIVFLAIVALVPALIAWLEKDKPLKILTAADDGLACNLPSEADGCEESFLSVLTALGSDYFKNVWMLAKPTLTLMVLASFASAALLTVHPYLYKATNR